METLIKIISAFPKDTALPIPMCKDSAHLLARLNELQVYTKNGVIGFVILLPLVIRCNFNIYRLIPIPVPLDRTKFLYVDTSKTFLWIDKGDSTTSWPTKDGKIQVRYWIICSKFVNRISPSFLLTCMRIVWSSCYNPWGAFPLFVETNSWGFNFNLAPNVKQWMDLFSSFEW